MSQTPIRLLNEALELPPAERGRIAAELIDSLDAETEDAAVREAWSSELERRLQDIESGRVTMTPWSEARQRI